MSKTYINVTTNKDTNKVPKMDVNITTIFPISVLATISP